MPPCSTPTSLYIGTSSRKKTTQSVRRETPSLARDIACAVAHLVEHWRNCPGDSVRRTPKRSCARTDGARSHLPSWTPTGHKQRARGEERLVGKGTPRRARQLLGFQACRQRLLPYNESLSSEQWMALPNVRTHGWVLCLPPAPPWNLETTIVRTEPTFLCSTREPNHGRENLANTRLAESPNREEPVARGRTVIADKGR